MTTFDYRTSEVNEQAARSERARRAVAAFRRMQPMLNNYARTFTGNPRISVEVSATSNGATDGRKIFFRPPIELGDEPKHQKKLCDKRDEVTLQQRCQACELREHILVVIYHEIAHICYGTFAQPSDQAQADLLRRAIENSGTKYAAAITERVNRLGVAAKQSYLTMAGTISPFLPIILNAVEDARVNNNLFAARKGTRAMFDADTYKTFDRGVETLEADGTPKYLQWRDREQNLQLIVGLYCGVSEYDYADWFIRPVVDVLDDSIVQELMVKARTTKNVDDNYQLSFKFLERFRQLGFCKTDQDPEDEEPEPEEETEDDAQPDDESAGSEPPADDVQPEEDNEESADPSDGDSEGESDDADSDPQDNAELSDEGAPDPDAEGDDGSDEQPGSANGESEQDSDDETDQFGESDEGTAELEGDTGGTQATEGGAESNDGGEETDDEQESASETEADDSGSDGDGQPSTVAGDQDGNAGDDPGADDEGLGDSSDAPESDQSDSGEQSSDEAADDDEEPGAGSDGSPDDGAEPDAGTGESGESVDGSHGGGTPDFSEGEESSTPGEGDAERFIEDDEAEDEFTADPEADTKVEREENEGDRPVGDEDDEPIDTGADEGMGGIEVEEIEAEPEYAQPMGTADEVNEGLQQFGHHEEKEETAQEQADNEAILTAIMQGQYFETPSENIAGVRIHEYGKPVLNSAGENMSTAWGGELYKYSYSRRDLGIEGDFHPEESIIGRQLLKLRVVFADNQRSHNQNHLKSGRINTRVLGRRAPLADERLFRKKSVPGKKSYFVAIMLDISGSTVGRNLQLIKQAAWAQADLLTRLGIPFAMYGCSGYYDSASEYRTMYLDLYPVKLEKEVWNASTQERLQELGPDGGNLDGHNLEFARKLCDSSQATDNIIMYYSDGKMPATNYAEELEILNRELATCKKRGYVVAGVGVRTDSPSRHGLPTVQIDHKNDIGRVVVHLEKMLRAKL